ncbi:unnamed protein product [Trypanosoma congolense IL3000]|uniref:WGS project CAEQ00000000 data, annotated contig 1119 n=1 Tax=Trypanosoma congolense (strain IL3000) TaxID=1068625 RepID=F9W3W5_TRYCI|nr:unnamed protein product [Trypanosoma congolense IL3000]
MVFQTYCLNDMEKEIETTYAVPILYEWCPSLQRHRPLHRPPYRPLSRWCYFGGGGAAVGGDGIFGGMREARGILGFLVEEERVVHPELQSGHGAFRFLRVARHFSQIFGGVLELLHPFDATVTKGVIVIDTNIPNLSDRVFATDSVCIWCDIHKHEHHLLPGTLLASFPQPSRIVL